MSTAEPVPRLGDPDPYRLANPVCSALHRHRRAGRGGDDQRDQHGTTAWRCHRRHLITASKNHLEVVLKHSVIASVPMILDYLLSRYDFRPSKSHFCTGSTARLPISDSPMAFEKNSFHIFALFRRTLSRARNDLFLAR